MKAFYDSKPSALSEVGNGSYLYRYDIQEEVPEVNDDNINEEKTSQWSCQEVTVWGPLTSNKITQAVITDRWDGNQEQKLVNEYNGANLGLYGTKSSDTAKAKIAAYTDYLTERARLKALVDADCETLNID